MTTKTTQQLFIELLQVAAGKTDCLDRGPSPEEWQTLYTWSKEQKVEGICYHGVERLFEFGLRAPQDISIDWMAEAETIRETNSMAPAKGARAMYDDALQDLRRPNGDELQEDGRHTIAHLYRMHLRHQLDMRAVMDYYYTLVHTNGKAETLRDNALLGLLGVRRFARGMAWLLGNVMLAEPALLPFKADEKEGRFLLSDVMRETSVWQRVKHVLTTYPLGIAGLRA